MSDLQNFDHLLDALQGEAREAVRRYPISEENYEHVIDLLHTKYGDDAKMIACLQTRLVNAKAEKSTTAQRRLSGVTIPMVTQLEEKGVSLDEPFLAQKVLAKFFVDLQRKVQRCA